MKINFAVFSRLTVSQTAAIAVAAIVFFAGLLISILTWVNLTTQLEQKFHYDTERQLQRLANSIAPSIISQDRISLNFLLAEWNQGSEINGIQVFDNSLRMIAENGRFYAQAPETSLVITQDNLAVGSLRANLNLQPIHDLTFRYLTLGLLGSLICALLTSMLTWFFTEYFLGYLHKFANTAEAWQLENTPLQLPKTPSLPQLGRIHDVFKRCADQQNNQQNIEQALLQFAGNTNARILAGEYQASAILFIEISNIKELQKYLSAEQLIATLNRYYWLLEQSAKLYDGQVERYVGNGAVVVFSAANSESAEQSALHCLYAAKLFLGLIETERLQHTKYNVDFKLAVHFGELVLAPMVTGLGRCDLVGDSLHWTAHLAGLSEPQTLLASDAFHRQLAHNDTVEWSEGEPVDDWRGNQQATWRLESFSAKAKALINRQIERINSH